MTGNVLDTIPDLLQSSGPATVTRGREIQAWLAAQCEIESFVILDDSDDMEHLSGRLVQTTFDDGLSAEHAAAAIRLLS